VSDYLWDGSGEVDPDVAALEKALSPLRQEPGPLRKRHRSRGALRLGVSLAAAVVLLGVAGVLLWQRRDVAWEVTRLAGSVAATHLHAGEVLETDAVTRVSLQVASVGNVVLLPKTRVRLLRARRGEQRLELTRGTLEALIVAPPALFQVETPWARAIDLGCAYRLQVDDDGSGLLDVTHGWVVFEEGRARSYVPTGASCRVRRGRGLGAPFYRDASVAFQGALERLETGDDGALEPLLEEARPRDGFTLLALVPRLPEPLARRAYAALTALVPEPAGVTFESTRAMGPLARRLWWEALGLKKVRWWSAGW